MFWAALALVLAAVGLLVAALASGETVWAWGSVGASGLVLQQHLSAGR